MAIRFVNNGGFTPPPYIYEYNVKTTDTGGTTASLSCSSENPIDGKKTTVTMIFNKPSSWVSNEYFTIEYSDREWVITINKECYVNHVLAKAGAKYAWSFTKTESKTIVTFG